VEAHLVVAVDDDNEVCQATDGVLPIRKLGQQRVTFHPIAAITGVLPRLVHIAATTNVPHHRIKHFPAPFYQAQVRHSPDDLRPSPVNI
jgi:hypothetical protein